MQMDTKSLISLLQNIGPESCPEFANFHCHTTFSDGSLSPHELIEQACSLGIRNLAVTDHHSTQAYGQMIDWLKFNKKSDLQKINLW